MATERSFGSTTLSSRKNVTRPSTRSASLGLWSSMLNGPRTPPKIFSTASTTAWCSAETSALPVMGLMRGMRSSFREAGFVRGECIRSVTLIGQWTFPPPSTRSVCPVMKSLSSEARKTNVPTRSRGTSAHFQHPQIDVRLLALGRDVLLVLAAQREAGGDRVHADAELPQLPGQRAGEAHHAALGGGVVDVVRDALEEGARGDVDDGALAARLHGREHGPRAQKESAEVDRHDPVPLLDGNLHEGAPLEGAVEGRVVDQHVDAAESREGFSGEALRVL